MLYLARRRDALEMNPDDADVINGSLLRQRFNLLDFLYPKQ